ncbi:allantoinase AllB [Amnibacterium sp.]|uniref:allantoinase AllB n=1 Tax=Amnibacterium sp. TaxID=1872496 RepID=UPI003F7BE9A8
MTRRVTDLVLASPRVLVDGAFQPACVSIADGRIVRVAALEEAPADAVRLGPDEVLLPGLVDTHVHVNEPGRTEWEGFRTATAAAAAGGVTTLIDMPLNAIPPTVDVPALELKRAAAAPAALVDIGFWGGAVPGSLGRLLPLWEEGVFGFKCFLAPSGVDEFPHLTREQLDAALDELAGFDGLLIVHAEDPEVLDRAAGPGGPGYPAFVASRPEAAETTAIAAVIDGLRRTGGRAHILHLSAASAVEQIRAAKAEGLRITAETCPHYLVFDEAHIPDGATQYKCCPPIRDAANQDVLWAGLLDGTIDLVVSDHSPSTAERKFAGDGDFQVAWGGIAGLQFGLPAVWTAARRRGVPLETVVGWCSSATADFAGLAGKGRIAPGADADLVVFAPEAAHRVDPQELRYRNRVSAYIGHDLVGAVRRTYLAGEPVDASGSPRGRLLTRP